MPKSSFHGLRVLSLESRRAAEIATLISNFEGVPTVAPALREVPIADNPESARFADAVERGDYDAIVFLTGVGARTLFDDLDPSRREAFLHALRQTTVIVRGPKPLGVMREWQVPVKVTAPEPNTWRELVSAIDAASALPPGARVAVQEYGASNPELLEALRDRGATVTPVAVYEWALPEDIGPLERAVAAIAGGAIDVVLFTTQIQLRHLLQVARSLAREEEVLGGLRRMVVASIGPTTSDELRRRGVPPDLEASHPKMGVLVTEAAARAGHVLTTKGAKHTKD
jgi:uroporphyrinogen-III synthase